ncbi:MAG: hypothetical protein A3G29_08210 [Burkholderiales bacterium RIFCSPLOWO2_12_FULL_64_99]|nr:MAG: hypothetical protein A3G29_08210 [Burkholderiales bacterium RIFCSPLOWO2_12_FULL_64_99]
MRGVTAAKACCYTLGPVHGAFQGRVRCWPVFLRLEGEPDAAVLDMLAPVERQELRRLRQRDDRLRYAATRAALRQILAREYGLPPPLNIARNASGKPMLADAAGLDFNVSHAGARALIAVTRAGQVGVDVEKTVPLQLAGLAELVCTSLEQAGLARLPVPARQVEFFRLWVGKEAVLKSVGLGIAGEHMPLLALQDDGSVQAQAPLPFDVAHIQLEMLPIANGYCAAVALSSARH